MLSPETDDYGLLTVLFLTGIDPVSVRSLYCGCVTSKQDPETYP